MASKHESRFDKIQESLEAQDFNFLNKTLFPEWDDKDLPTSAKNYETILRDAVAWAVEFPGRKIFTIHLHITDKAHEARPALDAARDAVDSKICKEFGIPDLSRFKEGK